MVFCKEDVYAIKIMPWTRDCLGENLEAKISFSHNFFFVEINSYLLEKKVIYTDYFLFRTLLEVRINRTGAIVNRIITL